MTLWSGWMVRVGSGNERGSRGMTTPTDKPFSSPASPIEKLEVLLSEQRLRNEERKRDAGTFLSHTHNDEGGRFAKPQQIVGAKPVPEYPAGPNWAPQAVGVEPPLGFDINETPVVGEPWEVEASLERAEQQASPQSLDAQPPARGGEAVPLTSSATSSASPTQSQTPPSRDFATGKDFAKVFAPSRRKPPR
jgi:hypothetical protein